jgi:hypothetical protein
LNTAEAIFEDAVKSGVKYIGFSGREDGSVQFLYHYGTG